MSDTMLVRIKPHTKRELHSAAGVTIKKKDGWVRVPRDVAAILAEEPLSILGTNGLKVFDVKEEDEAQAIEEQERTKVEPAGTASAPKVMMPGTPHPEKPAPSMPPPPAQKRVAVRKPKAVKPS